MNAVVTGSNDNDKVETTSEGTPSTVSADKDDMTTTPSSPISFDQLEFKQHFPTTNTNENQTGTLSLPERKNVDEHGQVAATKPLQPISSRPSYRHKAAPWYAININVYLDLAAAMLSSLIGLFVKRQAVEAPSFPSLKTSLHQNVEGEYEELWLRSPGVRCSERTLVYMVPGNPGLVKAMLNFMSMICDKHDFDGYICGHLGHCSYSTKVFGMKDQIAHHSRMIKKQSESYHKVLVLGHSTGSYIIFEINDILIELGDRLLGIGLFAPTLTRFPPLTYWFLHALLNQSKLTSFLSEAIIKLLSPAEIWEELRNGLFVPNMKSLLKDTLDVLPDEPPSERLAYWGFEKRKIFIISSSSDRYTSPDVQHWVRCCTESPDTSQPSVLMLSSIRHCFVLFVEESKLVSFLLEQWIANKRFDCLTCGGFTPDCPTSNKDCVNYFGPIFWRLLSLLVLSFIPIILHPVFRK